jgi:hypothetical protein
LIYCGSPKKGRDPPYPPLQARGSCSMLTWYHMDHVPCLSSTSCVHSACVAPPPAHDPEVMWAMRGRCVRAEPELCNNEHQTTQNRALSQFAGFFHPLPLHRSSWCFCVSSLLWATCVHVRLLLACTVRPTPLPLHASEIM